MENLTFSIKNKNYSTEPIIVGRIADLWRLRSALAMGAYGQMKRMYLADSDEALMTYDIEAFFTVFCPKFIKDMKPTSISEMGVEDYLELKEVYVNEILPWLSKVEGLLKKKEDE